MFALNPDRRDGREQNDCKHVLTNCQPDGERCYQHVVIPSHLLLDDQRTVWYSSDNHHSSH